MALKVLIVQTDSNATKTLAQLLKPYQAEISETRDLRQAELLTSQVQPELIFLDMHFPGKAWENYLRLLHLQFPKIKVIVTNRHPDLQREIYAREQGVAAILRQPFTRRWMDQAIEKTKAGSQSPPSIMPAEKLIPPRIRMPVRFKITLPYLLLALLFALGAAYIVSQVLFDSIQDRYYNQLIATAKQSTDWMVKEEDRLLSTVRLAANTQGVADAIVAQDAEQLRDFILPIVANAGEETVEILDQEGVSLLSLRRDPQSNEQIYNISRGETYFQTVPFVQIVLAQKTDQQGDKFSGWVDAPWGKVFYICGPIFNGAGNQVGVVLVGKSIASLAHQMQADALGSISVYDQSGNPLVSTLFSDFDRYRLDSGMVAQVITQQDQSSRMRELTMNSVDYTELLASWEVRNGMDIGILGVSLPQAYLVRTSQQTRLQIFVLSLIGIIFVVIIGIYLANLITRPIVRLSEASTKVAQGDLDIKVDTDGDDEVAVLAHSFNSMVAGLQEGSIYRDLLGRTVSPEVREQLRQTFSSGRLRLEGQEAVATVLMTDIRDFTKISEHEDPSTIFAWLNEYFDRTVPVIISHGGVVNKFDGDAILAFFGILPRILNPEKSTEAACEAALEIGLAIEALNVERQQRGEPVFITGVGINTGVVIAGGLGTRDRMHYTIIGDTVNTTQRLESLTRELCESGGILISQASYASLGKKSRQFQFSPAGNHTVRGREEQISVYRLLGKMPEQETGKAD
jgi:adenylate cyclase